MKWLDLALLIFMGYRIITQIVCVYRKRSRFEMLYLVFQLLVFFLLFLVVREVFGAEREGILSNLWMWLMLVGILGPDIVGRLVAGKGPWFPTLIEPVDWPWKTKPNEPAAPSEDATASSEPPKEPA
jgi:hypothetical protein